MQNTTREILKKYGTITLASVAFILSLYGHFHKKIDPQIGVVDMKKMVSKLSNDLVKQYPTGQIPKETMDKFIGYIHMRIQLFAQKHNKVIFLNRQNMLLGDYYDCTDDIIEAIQNTK